MQANHTEFLQLLNGEVQDVVPRWQRRYCWDESDIERLVRDLVTIAEADRPGAAHYGGALLTFPESTTAGGVPTHRVVDGQQRLTTVSILLACIAESLGSDDKGGWTARRLKKHLTNTDVPQRKRLKLRLQDEDEDEYRRGLNGDPSGPGAVAQAWRIARRLVAQYDVANLLQGIERFRVVAIALDATDDPQQIFESLNATGRPLTESEKVKNWLLMGLDDEKQQDLHDNHWIVIERKLGVERNTEPVDLFLRDFLRWKTGKNLGIKRVHEEFRRWAVREGMDQDRPALCRELARLARLYGILTGTAGKHADAGAERALRHLRAMGIDTHRPLTLRLLDDAARGVHEGATDALTTTLEAVGTWITRLWVANRPLAGLNTAATELAHRPGPDPDAGYSEYWFARIRRLRNTRVGVPVDDEVGEGVRNRQAYGGSATRSSFALLCALMEGEHGPEAPARDKLTIEHVIPRTLTDDWKRDLGGDAEDLHGRWRDRLANLTLSGDTINSGMGAGTFVAKREVYADSTIGMTRRVANESTWNEEALDRRALDLAERVLDRWPWKDRRQAPSEAGSVPLKWRITNGRWRGESTATRMVLNVAGALLTLDPGNAARLSGDAISSNLHPATRYPPGTQAGTLTMRAVSGHDEYVLYPYRGTYRESADFCRKMGERCGVKVEVELEDWNPTHAFWEFFKENVGAVSGQTTAWRSATQRTAPVNAFGDRIRIHAGKELLRLDMVVEESVDGGHARAQRVREFSRVIRNSLSDQVVEDDRERGEQGFTASVERTWAREDKGGWAEATRWIKDQHDRLLAIAEHMGGSFVSAAEEEFLKSCNDYGKAVFSRILAWSRSRSLSVRWGAKGFSVGVDVDVGRVVVCYGYPPDSVYGQSLYTALRNRAGVPKTHAPSDAVEELWTAAEATGLLAPAGRELKLAIDRDLSIDQVGELLAWCESIERAIIEHGAAPEV